MKQQHNIYRGQVLPISLSAVFVLAAIAWLASSRVTHAGEADQPIVTLLQADRRHIVVRVRAPYATPAAVPGAAAYARIDVPGMTLSDSAGQPALPYAASLLAVPPSGMVDVSVLSADCQVLAGEWRVEPAPTWSLGVSGPDYVQQIQRDGPQWQTSLHEDSAVYDSSAYFPAQAASATDPQIMRSRRLVSLEVYPWQVSPATGRVRYCGSMDVQVSFSQPAQLQETPRTPDPTFDSTFANAVLNWDEARTWQPSGAPADGFAPDTWESGLRVTVAGPGLYRLTYNDLVNAGVPVASLVPTTLRMSLREQNVAIQVTGERDGHFDPGDEVRFYVAPYVNRYSTTAVYWLRWGGASGLRMASRNATPAGAPQVTSYTRTRRLEAQQQYRSEAPVGQTEDHWYYQQLYAYTGHETDIKSFPFTTSDVSGAPGVTVVARLLGENPQAANPDHWIRLWLNGQVLGTYSWDGSTIYTATVNWPATALLASNVISGEISLAALPGVTNYWVAPDWFKVQYQAQLQAANGQLFIEQPVAGLHTVAAGNFPSASVLALDISDPLNPVVLTGLTSTLQGSTYTMRFQTTANQFQMAETGTSLLSAQSLSLLNSADLRSTALGADYILIGPSDLLAAAQPLVTKRQAQGLRVKTVDVDDIFDQFAGGFREPQALRDFLTYAYFNWQAPPPTYVALLGDGHYDYRNDTGLNYRNPIPPYLAPIDPWIGETAADNEIVSVNGPADFLPDMNVGRMPANTTQEVQTMLDKMSAYDAAASGSWQTDAVYVADIPDAAGDFHAISDEIRNNWLSPEMVSTPIYIGNPPYTNDDAIKAALMSSWSDGAFFTQWFGHGSKWRWGATYRGMTTDWEPDLPLQTRLPLLAEWGCWTGYFIVIEPPGGLPNYSLSEMLTRTPGKGAINDISATGLHTSNPLAIMAHGLHKSLFTDRDAQAGAAFTAMKLYFYANSGAWHDVIYTIALFGDPAQVLRLPVPLQVTADFEPNRQWVPPGQSVAYTLQLNSNSGSSASATTWVTLTLPTGLGVPQNLSATVSNPTYDPQAHQITWNGPVFLTTPVTISFNSMVSPDLTACGQLAITGTIRDSDGHVTNVASAVHLAVPDVDCSGAVNIVDVQQVAGSWALVAGNPGYDPRLDLNGDNAIDLQDILIVADRWQ